MHKPLLLILALSVPMALVACNGDDDNTGRFVDAGPKNYANEPPTDSGPGDATVDGATDAATDATTQDASDTGTTDASDAGTDAADAADAAAE